MPPSSISRFCTEEGAPVLKPTGSRDSNTPYSSSIRTDTPHIYLPSQSLHYDDAHIKVASSHDPRRVSYLHDVVLYDPQEVEIIRIISNNFWKAGERFSLYIRKHFGCDGEKLKISFCTDNWWANCPLRIRKSYSALHFLKK